MLSGAILIFGSTTQNREEKMYEIIQKLDENLVEKETPDLLVIKKAAKKKSIGIGEVRKITKFLATKPYSSNVKVVGLHSAETLTVQAQNALLKTLEEPPTYATVILSSKTENALLPTILSRCRKIKAGVPTDALHETTTSYEIEDIRKIGFGKKLELAQEFSKKDREEVVALIEDLVYQERQLMLEKPSKTSTRFIKKALEIKTDLEETNVSARLALENLLING